MSEDPKTFLEGRSRETRIRRDARGVWWNGEERIDHELLSRAFDSWITRAEDGRYCLSNDINWAYVTIEGAPLFIRKADVQGNEVRVHSSDGRSDVLDVETLREGPDGALYSQHRNGTMAARWDSHAAVQLSPLLEEREGQPRLILGDRAIAVPRVEDPLEWPLSLR